MPIVIIIRFFQCSMSPFKGFFTFFDFSGYKGLRFGIYDLGFTIWDLGFGIYDLGFTIYDLGFTIWVLPKISFLWIFWHNIFNCPLYIFIDKRYRRKYVWPTFVTWLLLACPVDLSKFGSRFNTLSIIQIGNVVAQSL